MQIPEALLGRRRLCAREVLDITRRNGDLDLEFCGLSLLWLESLAGRGAWLSLDIVAPSP
jgi:hypothetical protein